MHPIPRILSPLYRFIHYKQVHRRFTHRCFTSSYNSTFSSSPTDKIVSTSSSLLSHHTQTSRCLSSSPYDKIVSTSSSLLSHHTQTSRRLTPSYTSGEIDLHDHTVLEAIEEVKEFLFYHLQSQSSRYCTGKYGVGRVEYLVLVTGRGSGIKPKVEEMLVERGLKFKETHKGGCFIVKID